MVFGYLNILTEPAQNQKMMDVLFLKYVVEFNKKCLNKKTHLIVGFCTRGWIRTNTI